MTCTIVLQGPLYRAVSNARSLTPSHLTLMVQITGCLHTLSCIGSNLPDVPCCSIPAQSCGLIRICYRVVTLFTGYSFKLFGIHRAGRTAENVLYPHVLELEVEWLSGVLSEFCESLLGLVELPLGLFEVASEVSEVLSVDSKGLV